VTGNGKEGGIAPPAWEEFVVPLGRGCAERGKKKNGGKRAQNGNNNISVGKKGILEEAPLPRRQIPAKREERRGKRPVDVPKAIRRLGRVGGKRNLPENPAVKEKKTQQTYYSVK